MTEIVHSGLAAVLVYAIIACVLTLAARAMLARRAANPTVSRFGDAGTIALIVGPTFLAALWVGSAFVHELEPGRVLRACCAPLAAEIGVGEFLVVLFSVAIALGGAVVAWEIHRSGRPAEDLSGTRRCSKRIARVCAETPTLARLGSRIRVVEGLGLAAATRGTIRPQIEVDHTLLGRISDDELSAILLHEAAHLVGRDPARMILAALAIGVNPLGGLLRPALNQWRFARELQADAFAVIHGADPLSLAAGMVTAARQTSTRTPCCAAAADSSPAEIRSRVEMLSGYAFGRNPAIEPTRGRDLLLPGAATVLALSVPHLLPESFSLHCWAESVASYLLVH